MAEAGDFYLRKNNGLGTLRFGELVPSVVTTTPIVLNTWNKLDIISDNTNIYLYLNAVEEDSTAVVGNGVNWDEIIYIGRGYRNLRWSGQLTKPVLRTFAASPGQVINQFEAERSLFGA